MAATPGDVQIVMAQPGIEATPAHAAPVVAVPAVAVAQVQPVMYGGLAVLAQLDGLFIKQKWDALEAVTGGAYEAANKYTIYTPDKKTKLFKTKEKTGCCWRICCGEHRPFRMKVSDITSGEKEPMMIIKRHFAFCGCALFPCCQHNVSVHYLPTADGGRCKEETEENMIATVGAPWGGGWVQPKLVVRDREGTPFLEIVGPFGCVSDCLGADFKCYDMQGTQVGEIKKVGVKCTFKSIGKELATDADNFLVTFPPSLPPPVKMAILAAVFQIDFMFFEDDRGVCEGRCCDMYCCGCAVACLPCDPSSVSASDNNDNND